MNEIKPIIQVYRYKLDQSESSFVETIEDPDSCYGDDMPQSEKEKYIQQDKEWFAKYDDEWFDYVTRIEIPVFTNTINKVFKSYTYSTSYIFPHSKYDNDENPKEVVKWMSEEVIDQINKEIGTNLIFQDFGVIIVKDIKELNE